MTGSGPPGPYQPAQANDLRAPWLVQWTLLHAKPSLRTSNATWQLWLIVLDRVPGVCLGITGHWRPTKNALVASRSLGPVHTPLDSTESALIHRENCRLLSRNSCDVCVRLQPWPGGQAVRIGRRHSKCRWGSALRGVRRTPARVRSVFADTCIGRVPGCPSSH